MGLTFNQLRPVYVVGIGMHPYQRLSETSFVELGLTAVREAIADAAIPWEAVESAYVGSALLPLAPGRPMLRHMGSTGLAITHIENASATGSAAFRQACIDVISGVSDISIAIGLDKPRPRERADLRTGIPSLAEDYIVPFTHFALLTNRYVQKYNVRFEDVGLVAVKNHRNGALNPYAQRRQVRSLDEVMGGARIAGHITPLQGCPIGEGAAATIVASKEGIERLNIDASRAIRVSASSARSQRIYDDPSRFDSLLTAETTREALADAGRRPDELDMVELHDAFAIEELEFIEHMGVCPEGTAVNELKAGAFDIGGRCAVNASGGLIAMGHPIGPTGLGQINELTRQLRSEAGPGRQHSNAKVGLAHMVGVGPVCHVHILERP